MVSWSCGCWRRTLTFFALVVLEHLHGAKSGAASQDFMAERTLVVLVGALVDLLVVVMSRLPMGVSGGSDAQREGRLTPHI